MTVLGCKGCAFEPEDSREFPCNHPHAKFSWFHQQGDVRQTCYYDYKSFSGCKRKMQEYNESSAQKPHKQRCEKCEHKDNDWCEVLNRILNWNEVSLISEIGCASYFPIKHNSKKRRLP